jgi:hypothetical protein
MNAPTLFSYLPKEAAEALCKYAEEEQKPKRPSRLMPILKGVAGMGLGTLAGAGAGHYGNEVYKHFSGGKNIPSSYLMAAAPIIGGGLGLAYNLAQAHQLEEMRRASEGSDDKPGGRVP